MVYPRRSSRLGEKGQAVEYSLLLVLIGVGMMAVLGLVGKTTKRIYAETSSAVTHPASYAPGGGVSTTTPSLTVGVPAASPAAPSDSTGSAASPDSLNALIYSQR